MDNIQEKDVLVDAGILLKEKNQLQGCNNDLLILKPQFTGAQKSRYFYKDRFNRFDVRKRGFYQEETDWKDPWNPERLRIEKLLMKVPNCPKIPPGPCSIYVDEHKGELMKENPQLSEEDVIKILKDRYSKLEAEKIYIYIQKAANGKAEYYRKLEQLLIDQPIFSGVIANALKFLRHPDQPLKPPKPMTLYYIEHKDEVIKHYPQLTHKEVQQVLQEKFLSLDAALQAVYEKKVLKATEEYWPKLEKFWKDHPGCNSLFLQFEIQRMKRFRKPLEDVKLGRTVKEDKSDLNQNAIKFMKENCQKLENFMKEHPECDNSSLRNELRRVIESVLTNPLGEPTPKDVILSVDVGVKRPTTEDISELNKQEKKRFSSQVMQNSSVQEIIVKAKSDGKKKKKKNKKVKKIVATIEVKVENEATKKEAGGLKQ